MDGQWSSRTFGINFSRLGTTGSFEHQARGVGMVIEFRRIPLSVSPVCVGGEAVEHRKS